MSNISDKIRNFANKYYIGLLSDSKRWVKSRPIEYFFTDVSNKDICTTQVSYETEPMITLDIPLSKLNLLIEIESTFFNHASDEYHRRHFESLMAQISEERYLRSKHPAVQSAYEQYSMMLHLCKEHPKKS